MFPSSVEAMKVFTVATVFMVAPILCAEPQLSPYDIAKVGNSERLTEWLYQCISSPTATVHEHRVVAGREGDDERSQLLVTHTGGHDNRFTMRFELISPSDYTEDGVKVSFLNSRGAFFGVWDVLRAKYPRDRYVLRFDREKQFDMIHQLDFGDLYNKYKFLRGEFSHVNLQYGEATVSFADCELIDSR